MVTIYPLAFPQLSPALRNRFTEIWCNVSGDEWSELKSIVSHNLHKDLPRDILSNWMIDFMRWCGQHKLLITGMCSQHFSDTQVRSLLTALLNTTPSISPPGNHGNPPSVRDALTWTAFLNLHPESLNHQTMYLHGACLVIVDSLSDTTLRTQCMEYLYTQTGHNQVPHLTQLVIPHTLLTREVLNTWLGQELGASDWLRRYSPNHFQQGVVS